MNVFDRMQGLLGGVSAFILAVTAFLKAVSGLRRVDKTARDTDPEQEEFDRLMVKRDELRASTVREIRRRR
jgi:hypothetical protein